MDEVRSNGETNHSVEDDSDSDCVISSYMDKHENKIPTRRGSTRTWIKCSSKKFYTHAEDSAILVFVVKSDLIHEVKGNCLWKAAERDFDHSRTWQSLKNRFFKNILPKLERFAEISESEKEKLRKIVNPICNKFRRKFYPEEDKLILDYIIKNHKYRGIKGKKLWEEMADIVPNRHWMSLKERFMKRILPKLGKYDLNRHQIDLFK